MSKIDTLINRLSELKQGNTTASLVLDLVEARNNKLAGIDAEKLCTTVQKKMVDLGIYENRSEMLAERMVGSTSYYPFSRQIKLVVGREYVYNQKIVKVVDIEKDKVSIVGVVRGKPVDPVKKVYIKDFYKDTSRV